MNVLIDTNILLDIVLERHPFVEMAAHLLKRTNERNIALFITATTITDLYYIIRKAKGKDPALRFIQELLLFVEVAAVDKTVILQALKSEFPDFEDAVQEQAAQKARIEIIVTRNPEDFKKPGLQIYTPQSFLTYLDASQRVESD